MPDATTYRWASSYQDLTDLELVDLYKESRDLQVVGGLFYRYYDLLYGLTYKYMNSKQEAEDTCYEIFEILINKLKSHNIQHFKAWLYRLSSNYCIDKIRKSKTLKLTNLNAHFDIAKDMTYELDVSVDQRERLLKRIDNCMRQLSLDQKTCIDLFFFKEQSYKEIADQLEISWSKTRSHIQNGKRNLKICMESL